MSITRAMTENEMRALLLLFKSLHTQYNAHSLSKEIGLTAMGTLKILKRLEEQGLLSSREMGKATFYNPNLHSEYAKRTLAFLLAREAEHAPPRVKRWVKEMHKFESSAKIGILFGSVLHHQEHNDVDVLLSFTQQENEQIDRITREMGRLSQKKVHIVKQTLSDLEKNLRESEPVVISALKEGIVLFGYEELIEVIAHVPR